MRIFFSYVLRPNIHATPLFIQCDSSHEIGISRVNTKLVECPVVDKVPALARVLYKGHL